jgi:hypothetical protein
VKGSKGIRKAFDQCKLYYKPQLYHRNLPVLELPIFCVPAPLLVSCVRLIDTVAYESNGMIDTIGSAVDDAAFVSVEVAGSDRHAHRAVLKRRKNLVFVVREGGDAVDVDAVAVDLRFLDNLRGEKKLVRVGVIYIYDI